MQNTQTRAERGAMIADWRASGLSGAAYAQQHGINLHTLRKWARLLKSELNEALLSADAPHVAPSFIEMALPSLLTPTSAAIEVTLAGATVRVPAGADADTLAHVFAALRGVA